MSALGLLCQFAQQNPTHSASESLQYLTTQFQHRENYHLHPQHPGHPLALNQQLPGQFISPGHPSHLTLPMSSQNSNSVSASPHTLNNMSPALQNQMLQQNHHLTGTPQQTNQSLGPAPTSVGMVATQSQQGGANISGGNSQGTSAIASPNVTKLRRASAVKVEGEDGGGGGGGGGGAEVNGTGPAGANKVKASPRNNVKRQKGNG